MTASSGASLPADGFSAPAMAPDSPPPLAGLLLAAGESRRFGGPKAVAVVAGETLVAGAARRLLALCPAGVVVVTGAYPTEVRRALAGLPVRERFHPGWAAGMGSSIAAGMSELLEAGGAFTAAAGVLILPCDLPDVDVPDLARLRDAWAPSPDRVAAAALGGVLGPPVIFPRSLWPDLARLTGETGARALLGSAGEPLAVPLPGAARDVDAPGDLPER